MTMHNIIIKFMAKQQGCVATLKDIYEYVEKNWENKYNTLPESCRAVLYRHKDEFKRVVKGVYMYTGEHSNSLLLEGDGRKLEEIEDNSIDCIITDHPWSDKKAHKAGNQKDFVNYETFRYTKEDFAAKYRVMKDGAYLAEFVPIESATNWEYLSELKQMAKEAGFQYYASCIWRKAPEGTINTGRTTKGVEQILIFSKGKPRRLAPQGKPYMTNGNLAYEIDIPIKASEKHHQAEKPIELYEYLIEKLTNEKDVCLDQFGGACNLLKAAINKNRFAVVYEFCHEFIEKAVDRFKLNKLYDEAEQYSTCKAEQHSTYRAEQYSACVSSNFEQISLFA